MKGNEIGELISRTHALITKNEAELLFALASQANPRGVVVEIGSYVGGSAIFLAKGSKAGKKNKVYTIDPHKDSMPIEKIGREVFPKNSLPFFKENLKKENVEDIVVPIISTSQQAAENWDKPISLLWIDGNHDYEYVKLDFLLWEKHLLPGGVLALHDTHDSKNEIEVFGVGINIGKLPGPARVVKENLVNSKRFERIKVVDLITFARKKKNADLFELTKNKIIIFLIKQQFLVKLLDSLSKTRDKAKEKYNFTLGTAGLFLNKHLPKIYKILKKIKDKLLF